jgi:outer membrane immunogenic protein
MTKKWLVAMLGSAALTLSAGALAQQTTVPGFYIGAEVGQADFGSADDTAFKFIGGYQFHRNIAAEAGYGLLFDKGGTEVTALELVAVGLFPVMDKLSVIGKLGFAQVDIENGSDDIELTYGIGLQYDFLRNLGARVQWQRYDSDPEADLLSVGIVYRF